MLRRQDTSCRHHETHTTLPYIAQKGYEEYVSEISRGQVTDRAVALRRKNCGW